LISSSCGRFAPRDTTEIIIRDTIYGNTDTIVLVDTLYLDTLSVRQVMEYRNTKDSFGYQQQVMDVLLEDIDSLIHEKY